MESFNVMLWDFKTDKLVPYDVMPYLRDCYKEKKKRKEQPKTLEEFKNFVEAESRYRYWARCEYEMICHGWPVKKNEHKLDIHEQVMMNVGIIAKMLYDEFVK